MNSSIPKVRAIPRAPLTIRFPAATRNASPKKHNRMTRHRRCSPRAAAASLRCFRISIVVTTSQAKNTHSIRRPSSLDSSPSRNRMPVIIGISKVTGKSRFTLSREVCVPEKSREIPSIRAMFTTLLPSASPRAISGFPAIAALIDTDISGLDVANAATVTPTIPCETRAQLARPTAPRTKHSPPMPAHATPASNAKKSLIASPGLNAHLIVVTLPRWGGA